MGWTVKKYLAEVMAFGGLALLVAVGIALFGVVAGWWGP